MNNLPLQPLVWDWSYGDGGKTNAVCRAKSPSHEYIIRLEAGGDCYVDYRKFDNDEDSDNRKDEPPAFDSIKAAQDWAQFTHYPSKMQPYVLPTQTWISVDDRLPEEDGLYFAFYPGSIHERQVISFSLNIKRFNLFHDAVTHWMPLPKPPVSKQGE